MVTERVIVGTSVYTSDGRALGEVAEVRGTAFKVNAAMMPDYWLSIGCVDTSGSRGVNLECSSHDVADHRVQEPA